MLSTKGVILTYPLELPCGREFGADDQTVDITFRDKGKLLHTARSRGAVFYRSLAMVSDGVAKRRRRVVFQDPPDRFQETHV